ncbi:hypothetical protein CPB85DRAFT_903106 [Mucidula mucida]|nr:hypothetical protein CPB85DRAFT_903106 [Mucidula mucida]
MDASRAITREEFCDLEESLLIDIATAHNLPVLRCPGGSVDYHEFQNLLFPDDADYMDLPEFLSWHEDGYLVRNGIQRKPIAPPSILESFPDEDPSDDDEQSVSDDDAPPSPPCITDAVTWREAQADVKKQRDLRDAEQGELLALEARVSTRSLAAMWDLGKLKKSGKKLMGAIRRYGGAATLKAIVERAQQDVRDQLPYDSDDDVFGSSSSDEEDDDGPPPPPPPPPPGPGDGHNHKDDDDDNEDDDQPPHRPIAPRLIFPAPAAPAPEAPAFNMTDFFNSFRGPSPPAPSWPYRDHSPGSYPPPRHAPENYFDVTAPERRTTLHELLGWGSASASTYAPETRLYAPAARPAQNTLLAGLLQAVEAQRSATPGPSGLPSPPPEPFHVGHREADEVEEGLEVDPEEYVFLHGAQYHVPPPRAPYVPPEDEEEDDLYASVSPEERASGSVIPRHFAPLVDEDDDLYAPIASHEEPAGTIIPPPLLDDDDDLYATHQPIASSSGPGDVHPSSIDDEDDLYVTHQPIASSSGLGDMHVSSVDDEDDLYVTRDPAPAPVTSHSALQSAPAVDDDDDLYATSDRVTAPVASTSDAAESVLLRPVVSEVPSSTPPIASTSELPSDIPGLGSLEQPPSTSIHDEANDDDLPPAQRTRRQELRALIRVWERQARLHPSWVRPPARIVLDPPQILVERFGVKKGSEFSPEMQRRVAEIVDLQLGTEHDEQARNMIELICADLQAQQDRWEERMTRRHRLRRQTRPPQRQATPGPSRPRPSPAPSSRMMKIDSRGIRYSPFPSPASRKRPRDEGEAADSESVSAKRMRNLSASAFSTLPPSAAHTSLSAPPMAANRKRAREDDDDDDGVEDTPREGVRSGLWSWISSPFRSMPPPPPPPAPRAPSPPATVSRSPTPIAHPFVWPPPRRRKYEPSAGSSSTAIPYTPLPPAESERRGPVFDEEVKVPKKYGVKDYRRAPKRTRSVEGVRLPQRGFNPALNAFTFIMPSAPVAPPPAPAPPVLPSVQLPPPPAAAPAPPPLLRRV